MRYSQIRDRLPETAILLLQVLQTLGLVSTKAAIFLAPAIVTLLRYAERATSLTNGLALRQGHLGFAQHADNLFRGVAFTAHSVLLSRGQNAPNSLNKSGPLLGGHSKPNIGRRQGPQPPLSRTWPTPTVSSKRLANPERFWHAFPRGSVPTWGIPDQCHTRLAPCR